MWRAAWMEWIRAARNLPHSTTRDGHLCATKHGRQVDTMVLQSLKWETHFFIPLLEASEWDTFRLGVTSFSRGKNRETDLPVWCQLPKVDEHWMQSWWNSIRHEHESALRKLCSDEEVLPSYHDCLMASPTASSILPASHRGKWIAQKRPVRRRCACTPPGVRSAAKKTLWPVLCGESLPTIRLLRKTRCYWNDSVVSPLGRTYRILALLFNCSDFIQILFWSKDVL